MNAIEAVPTTRSMRSRHPLNLVESLNVWARALDLAGQIAGDIAGEPQTPIVDFDDPNSEVDLDALGGPGPPSMGPPGRPNGNSKVGKDGPEIKDPAPDAKSGTSGGPRAGMDFTPKGKKQVRDENRAANGGKLKCAKCGRDDLVDPKQAKGGQARADNEAQVDHIIPKAAGGDGSPSNGQVLCPKCNGEKSDKME